MRMMNAALRRLREDEPVSRLAIWSRRFAELALGLAGVAIVAGHARGGLARFFAIVSFSPGRTPDSGLGLTIFVVALIVAALAILAALGALASIWRRGRRGIGKIFAALAILALFLPYPAWLIYSAGNPPWLADISTDLDDPPSFSTTPDVVTRRSGWAPPSLDSTRRQEQAASYPDVKPIVVEMEMLETINAVHEAARQLGWTILEDVRPGGPQRPEGHIEAIAHSPALNLPIAIAIRIRPGEEETRVDMRVATRYLPNDLGAGAKLIGKLTDELEARDDSTE